MRNATEGRGELESYQNTEWGERTGGISAVALEGDKEIQEKIRKSRSRILCTHNCHRGSYTPDIGLEGCAARQGT